MKKGRYYIIAVLLFYVTNKSYSQRVIYDLLGDQKKIEIPFDYHGGYIMVDIKFDKFIKLRCIFDTGAQHTILFDKIYADLIGKTYEKEIKIRGSDLSTYVKAYIYRGINLTVGADYTKEADLIILDDNNALLDEIVGMNIDGIIGANFFHGLAVKIDYKKQVLSFIHPEYLEIEDDYQEVPLALKQNKPYIHTTVDTWESKQVNVELLLDTGAPISFMLHSNTDDALKPPANAPTGILAYGLGGPINGYIGKVNQLNVGGHRFREMFTNFQEVDSTLILKQSNFRNGIIGNVILRKFDIIIDYMRGRLYLKKNKYFDEEIKYDKSGITLFAYGKKFNDYTIKHVREFSPAYEAGLRSGDVITRIGWWSTRWYNLKKIVNKFKGKEGSKIKLTIRRGDQKLKTYLTLKDPLQEYYNFKSAELDYPLLYSQN